MIKTLAIIYLVVIAVCFFEAYYYAELDPESKKLLEEREKLQNKEK